ncbi:MAG: class I SAM-dependent methyltransferase [Actinomycetota bacterium]|nr:class I SAM-dependent methyltransferase [Actinomycetota bacterium]
MTRLLQRARAFIDGRPSISDTKESLKKNAKAPLLDALDFVRGTRDPAMPPRRLMVSVGSVGTEDFRREGIEMKRHFIEIGGLRADHDVLDVGCGAGRMAIPLTGYLNGRYEGFDVMPAGVRWCRRNLTPAYPNFNFQVADIRNRHYNPGGRFEAEDYRFPVADDSFDFVIQTSVLTHLLPAAAQNYLRETARVLRPGGTCFATYLLLDEARRELAARDALPFTFTVQAPDYWAISARSPEAIVAYPEADVLNSFEELGLEPTVHRGNWAGESVGLTWQDAVVARKPA